jgi:hypothetical protein
MHSAAGNSNWALIVNKKRRLVNNPGRKSIFVDDLAPNPYDFSQ